MLQHHFDRRTHVEKKIMGVQDQCEGGDCPDCPADRGADRRVFSRLGRPGHARGKAARRRSGAARRHRTGDGRALRTRQRVSYQRPHAYASDWQREPSYDSAFARIFESVAVTALHCERSGDRSYITVGIGNRQGLQIQFCARALS